MSLKRKGDDDDMRSKRNASGSTSDENQISRNEWKQKIENLQCLNYTCGNELISMNNMYAHEIEKLKSKVKQAKNALENKRSILQNKTKTTNYIFGRLKHYADEYDGEYNSLVSTAQLLLSDIQESKNHHKTIDSRISAMELETKVKDDKLSCLRDETAQLKSLLDLHRETTSQTKQKQLPVVNPKTFEYLVCIVCNNILIDPAVANCGHSFCSTCIFGHLLKEPTCITCGETVQSLNRSLVFDEFIGRLMDLVSPEEKVRRNHNSIARLSIRDHPEWNSWFPN